MPERSAGRFTAQELDKQNVQVKIFDINRERCRLIAEKLSGYSMAINGDGTNIELMQSEGIADADVMICLTDDDRYRVSIAAPVIAGGDVSGCVALLRDEQHPTVGEVESKLLQTAATFLSQQMTM